MKTQDKFRTLYKKGKIGNMWRTQNSKRGDAHIWGGSKLQETGKDLSKSRKKRGEKPENSENQTPHQELQQTHQLYTQKQCV